MRLDAVVVTITFQVRSSKVKTSPITLDILAGSLKTLSFFPAADIVCDFLFSLVNLCLYSHGQKL